MKIILYVDLFPWHTNPASPVFATSHPGVKAYGCKRYAVEVDLPDPADADGVAQGVAVDAAGGPDA